MINLAIVGPCGVGKSTVAKIVCSDLQINYMDFDALGIEDMNSRRIGFSPYSVSKLNFHSVFDNQKILGKFLLDIGGDTVFRPNVDNDERLEQIFWLKNTYSMQIVVLTARREILAFRFIATKNRCTLEFDDIWNNWVNYAQPNWDRCGDIFIDTSSITAEDISKIIKSKYYNPK